MGTPWLNKLPSLLARFSSWRLLEEPKHQTSAAKDGNNNNGRVAERNLQRRHTMNTSEVLSRNDLNVLKRSLTPLPSSLRTLASTFGKKTDADDRSSNGGTTARRRRRPRSSALRHLPPSSPKTALVPLLSPPKTPTSSTMSSARAAAGSSTAALPGAAGAALKLRPAALPTLPRVESLSLL